MWAFLLCPCNEITKLGSEVSFAKRYDFGCNFSFAPSHLNNMVQGGGETKVTPKIVPFSVSVLAVVTNKVELAISLVRTSTQRSRSFHGFGID